MSIKDLLYKELDRLDILSEELAERARRLIQFGYTEEEEEVNSSTLQGRSHRN